MCDLGLLRKHLCAGHGRDGGYLRGDLGQWNEITGALSLALSKGSGLDATSGLTCQPRAFFPLTISYIFFLPEMPFLLDLASSQVALAPCVSGLGRSDVRRRLTLSIPQLCPSGLASTSRQNKRPPACPGCPAANLEGQLSFPVASATVTE